MGAVLSPQIRDLSRILRRPLNPMNDTCEKDRDGMGSQQNIAQQPSCTVGAPLFEASDVLELRLTQVKYVRIFYDFREMNLYHFTLKKKEQYHKSFSPVPGETYGDASIRWHARIITKYSKEKWKVILRWLNFRQNPKNAFATLKITRIIKVTLL